MNIDTLQNNGRGMHLEPSDLLTPDELSQLLGVSVKTLAVWRYTGRHALPYIRCGASIRYQRQAVAEWLEKRTQTQTSTQRSKRAA